MTDNYLLITGISPKIWGRSAWNFLFSIALTYDETKKENYNIFFRSLENVLPCVECRDNYKKSLPGLNDALTSKKKLLLWLLNKRNEIAIENKNKTLTLNQVLREIFNNDTNTVNYQYIWIFIMTIVLVLFIYMFKFMNKK